MEIITYFILYVINIFLNRWLNKIAYKHADVQIAPQLWFVPILPTMIYFFILLVFKVCGFIEKYPKFINWFTGSKW